MSETRDPNTDQQLPAVNDRPFVQDLVIADVEDRKELGIRKYGTALQSGNGRDMLLDAYEEALDLAIYLRGVLDEQERDDADEQQCCAAESKYGTCGRKVGHDQREHAVCIGGGSDPLDDPEVWFVWRAGGTAVGWQSTVLIDSDVAHGLRADRYAEEPSAARGGER